MMSRTMTRLLLVVPLLAAGIALGAPAPAEAAFVCSTPVESIEGGTIYDSIVVQADQYCSLHDVTVRGGVTVAPGGSFVALNSEIRGSVSSIGAGQVYIDLGVVRGSVTVTGAGVAFLSADVRGNVTLNGSQEYATLAYATIRGSATLNDNVELSFYDTRIAANLTCLGNGTIIEGLGVVVGGKRNCTVP